MSDEWGLPDPVILALGAVAWGAINVESHGADLCEFVLSERQGRTPYGTFAKRALEALAQPPASAARADASAWIRESVTATSTRNAILHSQHLVRYPGGAGDPAWLNHWPNGGSDPIDTPLTEEHLLGVARSFIDLWDRWVDVYAAFADEIEPSQTF